ncbi:autotransporter outer membrane beta-barrel domain-containing protein [Pseudovibrio sp. POLY-S9]|uniref:autotransporter family protein n=1 Tax=Pseudovibrio sp. POLY-S9 TaxID=1576596 RepID=UPI00070FCB93|nr:autotransporter outer membrane beta-barrel domain-containing protein [Pseudovibrio sp. POLY-S9]
MLFKNLLLTTTILVSAVAYADVQSPALAAGSMILEGNHIKFGISEDGTLGYGNNTLPGIQYDETGTGSFNDKYDYLIPGTPFYGFDIEYNDGVRKSANNAGGSGISGKLTDMSEIEYNGTIADNRVIFSSSDADGSIKQDIAFDDEDKHVSVTISMTASIDMTDVHYGVFTDPDVQQQLGDSYITNNYVVDEENYNFVYSEATTSKAIIGFVTGLDNSGGGIASSWSESGKFYYNSADGVNSSVGDSTIGLGFYWASVLAGETVTFTYSLIFGTDIDDALKVIEDGADIWGDIDTAQDSYSTDDLNDGKVTSTFKGGTLKVSTGGALNVDFNVAEDGGTFDTDGNDVALTGKISGAGTLNKKGSGKMTFTGTQNQINGGFNVQGGEVHLASGSNLDVGDSKLMVADGAVLTGSGSVKGDLDISGTISPGNSPGTMVVNGNVTQNGSSTFLAEIDGTGTGAGAGSYDRLVLTGANSVYTAGGTLDLKLRGITGAATNTYTPEIGTSFSIVTAEGGVDGAYALVKQPTNGLNENSRLDVVYNENDVTVYVAANSYAQLAQGTGKLDAVAVANALDGQRAQRGLSTGNADLDNLYNGLLGLNASQTSDTLLQVSGSIYASSILGARFANRLVRDSILQHTAVLENAVSSQMEGGHQFGLWARSMGEYAEVDADQYANGFTSRSGGFLFGLDMPLSENVLAGLGTGISSNTVDGKSDGSGKTESYYGYGYLKFLQDSTYATVLTGVSWDNFEADRSVRLSNQSYDLSGKSSGYTAYADIELGHEVDLASDWMSKTSANSFYLSPIVGLRAEFAKRKKFQESGEAVVALQQEAFEGFSGSTKFGVKIGGEFELGETLLNINAGAFWLHGFGNAHTPTVKSSLGSLSWDVAAATSGRNAFEGSLGIDMSLSDNLNAQINASYITTGAAQSGQLHAGVSYKW